MFRRILIVTAVQAEADAIRKPSGTFVIAGGIGRVMLPLQQQLRF